MGPAQSSRNPQPGGRFINVSRLQPLPPFFKGGAENAPFRKGGRAQRGGISVGHCANLMWFDLAERHQRFRTDELTEGD